MKLVAGLRKFETYQKHMKFEKEMRGICCFLIRPAHKQHKCLPILIHGTQIMLLVEHRIKQITPNVRNLWSSI